MPSATIEKGKIVADTGAMPSLVSLMRALPEARFNSMSKKWTAVATPLACKIIADDSRFGDKSQEISNLALQFDEAMIVEKINDLVYGTKPWRHQHEAIEFAINKYATMLAMEMGTGKSLVATTLAANWRSQTIVVLCPRSVIGVWRREFEKHYPHDAAVLCLEGGTCTTKSKAVGEFINTVDGTIPSVIVCNYESAWREPLASSLIKTSPCLTILDESHRIKAHDGKASKFAYQLGKNSKRRLCLTGTPMPHSPLDLYAQFRFLEPALFGTSFTRFRSQYAKCNEMFASKVDEWINQDELKDKYSQLTFRVESADVLDLPSCLHEERKFELSPAARKAYDDMEDQMVASVESGAITASNALVKLLRLQQITSGSARTEDGQTISLGTDKQDALSDLLVDIAPHEPVVVFCRFSADIEAIREIAMKTGRRFGEISGKRKDLTPHATMPDDIDLMAVQEQAGGVGIDLTRARYAVWYSLSFSLGDYDQANARYHRPGQSRPVTAYHLIAKNTIDESVYRALHSRREVVNEVLSVLKR